MLKKLLIAALLVAASIPAWSQSGQLGPGQIVGNSTTAPRNGAPENITAILDRALGSIRGSMIERGASGWAIVGPGSTVGLPWVSNGTGSDPTYQAIAINGAGISGLGTGVATALGVNTGTAGAFVVNGGALGIPSSGTLTNATGLPANGGLTGQVPIANGGTGQATAVAARQSSGLNIYGDAGTGYGNVAQVLANTDRFAYTNAAFTASHAWTLPAANVTGQPYTVKIADLFGGVTGTNTLVITRAGADTINGGGTTATISVANGGYECSSDGSSKWSCLSGGVTSVTCGTGLSGGTITTSGTCSVALTTLNNSLNADVLLNNTANFIDGPSVAQGTSGTWLATGGVTLFDSANAQVLCKLWDGTTVIDSRSTEVLTAISLNTISLSGVIASPAANIKISCKDITNTTGKIFFNQTGASKDSTLTVVRIN